MIMGNTMHRPACTGFIALFLLFSCGASVKSNDDAILFKTAIITKRHVERALRYERDQKTRYRRLAPKGKLWFSLLKGRAPVVVVAGHATAHLRDGEIVEPDRGTAALALMLHDLTGAHVLYATHLALSDPNYYNDNRFKEKLLRLVRDRRPVLVLDLHTSATTRPYEVDFGTMSGASLKGRVDLLKRLARFLEAEGLDNFSQDYFAADKQETVTSWVADQTDAPSIQLEINAAYLLDVDSPRIEMHRFAKLLQAMVRFIRTLSPSPD